MKLYPRLLLMTLLAVAIPMAITGVVAYQLSRNALENTTMEVLRMKSDEAVNVAAQKFETLRKFGLDKITSNVEKAQIEAIQEFQTLHFDETGYVFVVNAQGKIIAHPDAALVGQQVEDQAWFAQVQKQNGTLIELPWPAPSEIHLAHAGYFEAWQWYIVCSKARYEIYGAISQLGTWIFGLAIVILGIAAGLVALVIRPITNPISSLVNKADALAGGQYETLDPGKLGGIDEIVSLGRSFAKMVEAVRERDRHLEQQVANRTHRLEVAATLSGRLNSILDIERLLQEFVNQVKEQFDYYHVQLYLLDKKTQNLTLNAGYGATGAEMLRQGHQISVTDPRSLTAKAAREGQTLIVDDAREDPKWQAHPLLPDVRAKIAVPIIQEGQMAGVLSVYSNRVGGIDESDAGMLRSITNQVAVALSNARLFAETQKRAGELAEAKEVAEEARDEAENARREAESAKEKAEEARKQVELQMWQTTGQAQLSERMSGGQNVAGLADNVVAQVCEYLNLQVGALYLLEDRQLYLRGGFAHGGRENLPASFKIGQGLVGQAAAQRKPIVLSEIPQDALTLISSFGSLVFRHLIAAPFLYENEVIGVVELGALHPFAPAQLQFLETAMERISVAFKTAQTRAQVDELLATTQQQTEELQSQSEELRIANEELEAQTQSLQLSEARLRENQAQLESANIELEKKASVLQDQQRILDDQNQELQKAQSALEQKASDLARASKYKSEFLANMSHELRTPLNSLLLLARMLQDNKTGNLTDDQVESLTIIHHSGRDLLELINEILDLSKVEAGRMEFHFEPVTLGGIQETMTAQFAHMAEEKGVEFRQSIAEGLPHAIISDEQRLKQIIKNLLSNAFKFTAQGSVTLSIQRPRQDQVLAHAGLAPAHTIAITVSDTGIGITPEQQRIIFEAFQQADGGTSRKYGGTGLGLTISREMAFRLGGYIGVESVSGRGSAFTLYLPEVGAPQNEDAIAQIAMDSRAAAPVPPRSPAPAVEAQNLASLPPQSPTPVTQVIPDDRDNLQPGDRTFLVIEDDAKFAKIVYNFAHAKNFKCLIAGDGPTGVHMAAVYQPTAITLDLRLPGIDGWGVLRRLKSDPRTRHIPVHVISVEDACQDAYKQGVLGFLTKPVSPDDLAGVFARIEEFIERQVKNLLIVEDDVNLRHSVGKLLAGSDVEIAEVGLGQQALELLRTRRFDCIILDLRLPDISGFDLLRQIHDDEALPKCPVIVYTGRELSPEDHAQLRDYADSIIVKEAKSPERLLDETALFLHRVSADLAKLAIQSAPPSPTNFEAALAGKQVLVVDDDMRNTFALSKLLREKGIVVHVATDGQHALDLLSQTPDIDLVLMDIMMPVLDGYETIRRIRAQSKFKNLPILALTAKAMKGDREKCLDAGANDYLPKPVDPDRLFSMLRVWLS